jgi:serine/threonine protein kinase
VKILDFGLAKLAGEHTRLTKAGSTLGTVAYMSPQQSMGEDVDARTDIWSLGVVLYEMLSGQLPFKGEHEQALVYLINNQEPESLHQVVRDIPSELVQIVNHALAKKLDSRYQSVKELLEDLKNYRKTAGFERQRTFGLRTLIDAFRSPRVAVSAVAAVLGLALVAVWFFDRQSEIRWAREVALLEVEKSISTSPVQRLTAPEEHIQQVSPSSWQELTRSTLRPENRSPAR